MTKEKLTEIMYLFRDLWCQNIDISTIDEFIDDLAEREVKLFAIPDVIKSVCDHKQVDLVRHACKCKKCGKVMETEW